MAIKKIKISELPLAQSLAGLFTIGVDNLNRSVRVGLEFVKTAADRAEKAAEQANEAAAKANTASNTANEAAKRANESAVKADNAAEKALAAVENMKVDIVLDLNSTPAVLWEKLSSNLRASFEGYLTEGLELFDLNISWDPLGTKVEISFEDGLYTEIIILEKSTSGTVTRSEEYIEYITI